MPASKLFNFPHDVFLMLRFEFVAICQDELEAKLLRIIEMHVDEQRKRLFADIVNTAKEKIAPDQIINIAKDVWASISHRLFMNDLYGTVTSENTLKKALKSLISKKLIFMRYDPKKRYDAPEYRLHTSVIQSLLDIIGKPGYQKLIPSVIDTLKNLPPQELTPSGCQELILSSQSRVSKIDTNYNKDTDNNSNNKEIRGDGFVSAAHTPTLSSNSHNAESIETEPARSDQVIHNETLNQQQGNGIITQDIDTIGEQHYGDNDRVALLELASGAAVGHPDLPHPNREGTMGYSDGSARPRRAARDGANAEPYTLASSSPDQQIATAPKAARTTNPPAVVGSAPPLQNPPTGTVHPQGRAQTEKPAQVEKAPITMPAADMPWGTVKCLQLFRYWRGADLIGASNLSQAAACAKGLVANYSEQMVTEVRTAMNADPYWAGRGGADVCEVARHIHQEVNKLARKLPQAPNAGPSLLAPVMPKRTALEQSTYELQCRFNSKKANSKKAVEV